MGNGALRALVHSTNLETFGVPVTVRTPDGIPVTGTGIWLTPERRTATDQIYPVTDIRDRDGDRRVLALPRSTFGTVPLGAEIAAPEVEGGTSRDWIVEGLERSEAEHTRVVVVPRAD